MPSIPMSALRRALAEMAQGAGQGARAAYGGMHIDRGITYGGAPGMIAGGALGAQLDDDGRMATNGVGAGMALGAGAGMLLGGGAGGVAKLASMAARGVGGGASGLSRGLRSALSERMAAREASTLDDAARFDEGFAGRGGTDARTMALTRAVQWAREQGIDVERMNPDELLELFVTQGGA